LGGFLIAPLTWLVQGFIVDKIRLRNLIASIIIFVGLLLSFSRGAWGSSVFCVALLIYFLYVTQDDHRMRQRIVFFLVAGAVAAVAIFMALSSIDAVNQMFAERSHLQTYDLNQDDKSRVLLWQDSLREIFNHPLGMGPWGFARATNYVSHNSYLGTMLNHGWVGGAAYLTLIALTLAIGFRTLWLRTPWQPFLIATYVSFVAMATEGLWGDTDHWRHFYILLGLIWGLVAATQKAVLSERAKAFMDRSSPLGAGMPTFRPNLEEST
jgi:O-antigen ligase